MNTSIFEQRYKDHLKHFPDSELTLEQFSKIYDVHNNQKLNRHDKSLPHSITNTFVGYRPDKIIRSKFAQQKCMAKKRNIPFSLTFEQWLKIWQDSGHLHERGRSKGKYVMSRYNDTGPYSVDNVFIQLAQHNVRDANLTREVFFTPESRKKAIISQRKYKYIAIDDAGNIIAEFTENSKIIEAGYHPGSVKKVCRGERTHHRGYKWRKETI